MNRSVSRTFAFLVLTGVVAMPASAADADLALTIYRASDSGLFDGGSAPVADGYSVIHERRDVPLRGGHETVVIGGLPATLDPQAVAIDLGSGTRVLAQRVLSAGDIGLLQAHRGERIEVRGSDGAMLAGGILVDVDGDGIGVRGDDGGVTYLREFGAVRFLEGSHLGGSTLQVVVDGKAGDADAALTYATSGVGWRAAYSALLDDANRCRMHLTALASIANRSGRDYPGAQLKLVAGEPNIQNQPGPQPRMAKAMMAAPEPQYMPEESGLGDYRSYVIGDALDLPDASVTQVPLYAPREVDCERSWVHETGGSWFPSKPNYAPGNDTGGAGGVVSRLAFTVDDNLPAGNLRVSTRDRDGRTELLGESAIPDMPKGRNVDVVLGNVFDLRVERERTAFDVDRAGRSMTESFRITVTNSGDSARTLTLREHPNRWRVWELASSSVAPSVSKPDLLEFQVKVDANGKADVEYTVRYRWTQADE
jgi:hypothetical protein